MARIASRMAECPLLAQSGHAAHHAKCPLLGVKRTLLFALQMSVSGTQQALLCAAPMSSSGGGRLVTICYHRWRTPPQSCSSGILGEGRRASAGAVVGLDVDERDRAAVDLPLGAL